MSKESHFGRHHWRDDFLSELQGMSGRELINLEPTKSGIKQTTPETVFGADSYMIKHCDVLVVYLSDDISVGGSQEILIAKYYKKPVVGLAHYGKKFNGSIKELFDETIEDYKDPFVFSTCDIVCSSEQEVAEALKNIESIKPKDIDLIRKYEEAFQKKYLENSTYLKKLL